MTNEQVYLNFLKAYAEWAWVYNAENPYGFSKRWGLCSNAQRMDVGALRVLKPRLVECFGECLHPFGSSYQYSEDTYYGTHHLNPARKAFVLSEIARLESAA
jgi:hypothetical protein